MEKCFKWTMHFINQTKKPMHDHKPNIELNQTKTDVNELDQTNQK